MARKGRLRKAISRWRLLCVASLAVESWLSDRIRGVQTGTRLRVWNGFGPILEEYDLQANPNAYPTLVTGGAAEGLLDRLNSMVEFWVSPEAGTIDRVDEKTLRSLGYL